MTIKLTQIPLSYTPTGNTIFHMSWRKKSAADTPASYTPLADATVNTAGTIIAPSPYQFVAADETIVVKAVTICGDEYQKTFLVCQPVTNLGGAIAPVCAAGFTLSDDKTYCFKHEEVPANPPSASGGVTVAKGAVQYSTCGTYIYSSYAVNGVGISSQIPLSNSFWRNGSVECVDNGGSDGTTAGPMNACALWSTTTLSEQDIGFSICIDIATTKTYYVGLGCDNSSIIKLDGKIVVQQDKLALDDAYSVGGSTFKIWHIYPVVIPAGSHILELIGHNDSSIAGLGAEVYDNTAAQLTAATSRSALNIVFSTKDYRGQPIQIGTDNIAYSCPAGFYLDSCQEPYVCKKSTTQSPSTGALSLFFNPETAYAGQYKIQIYKNEDLTTPTNTETISPTYPTTVTKNYAVPTYGNYTAKITALSCNIVVGQKAINAPNFCSPPRTLANTAKTTTTATFTWANPQYITSTTFMWEVYQGSTLVNTGTVTGNLLVVSGLTTATTYSLKLYTTCQPSVYSTPVTLSFTTN